MVSRANFFCTSTSKSFDFFVLRARGSSRDESQGNAFQGPQTKLVFGSFIRPRLRQTFFTFFFAGVRPSRNCLRMLGDSSSFTGEFVVWKEHVFGALIRLKKIHNALSIYFHSFLYFFLCTSFSRDNGFSAQPIDLPGSFRCLALVV